MNRVPANLRDALPYTKTYDTFLGCDFTTDPLETSPQRSPDGLNMIADDAGFPQKRVGWRVLKSYEGRINGIHFAKFTGHAPVIIVHHGEFLSAYDPDLNTTTVLTNGVNDAPSVSFAHGGFLYIMDGAHFMRMWYDGDAFAGEPVRDVAKEPTTGRGGHYEASVEKDENDQDVTVYTWSPCEAYEEPNILTDKMSNTFAGDGVNKVFWLTEKNCTVSGLSQRAGDGWIDWVAGYTVAEDPTVGKTKITFTTAPAAAPEGAGIDNFKVHFTTTEYVASPETIEHCNIVTQYGYFNHNRFFVSGNPEHKNRDWACAVDDPTYWELNQWTDVGSDQTAIMGYVHYGDVLAIIKEDDNQNAEIHIRSSETQSDASVLFPVQQGVKGVGSVSRRAIGSLRDDPLFFAKEGVFAVSGTDASQQRTIKNRSYYVDERLKKEPGKSSACAAVWGDLFVLAFPSTGHCYVADAKMQSPVNDSFVYEWFYWENIPASVFMELDGDLFFGTDDGRLCKFNSDLKSSIKFNDELITIDTPEDPTLELYLFTGGERISCRWITNIDVFGTATRYKTMMKRGCTCIIKPVSGGAFKMRASTNRGTKELISSSETIFDFTNVDFADIDFSEGDVLPVLWDFASVDFGNIDFNSLSAPYVYPINNKVKKFATLQMQFENDRPSGDFGLLGVQLQYIENSYIK